MKYEELLLVRRPDQTTTLVAAPVGKAFPGKTVSYFESGVLKFGQIEEVAWIGDDPHGMFNMICAVRPVYKAEEIFSSCWKKEAECVCTAEAS